MDESSDLAVSVRNVYKRHSKSTPYILKGINLSVKKNQIYALLGASGCGKTTLLSCIVGRYHVDYGQVNVFINTKKVLGHMPQQVALYTEFSVAENIRYFGYLYSMSEDSIFEMYSKLKKLLNLPENDNMLCGKMSGGQQRRLSLAITLLHDPLLLILDEPTAGTDPVLSNIIWNHLVELANRGKTVIITTHYIEEARQAHVIALMRQGVLLEESDPQSLLTRYNCSGLEEAFLHLCSKQSKGKDRENEESREVETPPTIVQYSPVQNSPLISNEYIKPSRFKAQFMKHFVWMRRNLPIMGYVVGLPIICMFAFNWAVGSFPDTVNVALVNEEYNRSLSTCYYLEERGCEVLTPMSCRLIREIHKTGKFNLLPFDTYEEAKQGLQTQKIWGILHFPKNYTSSFLDRFEMGKDTPSGSVINSNVFMSLDMTDYVTSVYIRSTMYDLFYNFLADYLSVCGYPREGARLPPFRFEKPIFGSYSASYTEFTAPGVICLIQFFLPLLFTTGAIIQDKLRGITERNLTCGVTVLEVTISTMIIQCAMLIVQTLLVEYIQYTFYGHPFNGDPWLTFALLYFQGICGTLFGIMICFITTNEQLTGLAIMAFSLPILVLSGFIWPIEAQPNVLQPISQALPVTYSIESVRALTIRGYGIAHPMVYKGFISSGLWSLFMAIVSYIQVRRNNGAP